ncbi:hypothetical protein B598_0856 [Chlamydia psittaci GR9]|nr:hypothetical protein B598_0856 [Chlamydia psittaci GR9]AFS23915.1 hypothetical protein B601_0859 [Chlamydia psittaci WS/RT/E30]EPJ32322.1 hypothetical protein CP061683_1248 [Chlamydia psittaci 06-1683]EPP28378.1 hypothetical protein CP082626L3_1086 [Chlamydia psittaci 08-2626_L3]EPP31249.1 hypothetical protein CPC197_0993 [Chlamydia psittaci C1/97]
MFSWFRIDIIIDTVTESFLDLEKIRRFDSGCGVFNKV